MRDLMRRLRAEAKADWLQGQHGDSVPGKSGNVKL